MEISGNNNIKSYISKYLNYNNLHVDKGFIIRCALIIFLMVSVRFVNEIGSYYIPLSARVLLSLNILFVIILPFLLTIPLFYKYEPIKNFFAIFISVALIYSLFDSLLLYLMYDVGLEYSLLYSTYNNPNILLGISFGFMAYSAGTIKKDLYKAIVIGLLGLFVLLALKPILPNIIYDIIINNVNIS